MVDSSYGTSLRTLFFFAYIFFVEWSDYVGLVLMFSIFEQTYEDCRSPMFDITK